MKFQLYRGTLEQFNRKKDTLPLHQGVVLLTDVNRLAYRDTLEPGGWGFVNGVVVGLDEDNTFESGEFTFGLNSQIRCDEGMVLFKGCQIVPSMAGDVAIMSLVFHQEQHQKRSGGSYAGDNKSEKESEDVNTSQP